VTDFSDVTVRPLAGRDELGLFTPLPYVLNEELTGDLADGRRRPEWMWAAEASSSASWLSWGRSLIKPTQPPRVKPSSPAGSCMTPWSETLSITTILPISFRLLCRSIAE
jgi:hypothetical protein